MGHPALLRTEDVDCSISNDESKQKLIAGECYQWLIRAGAEVLSIQSTDWHSLSVTKVVENAI